MNVYSFACFFCNKGKGCGWESLGNTVFESTKGTVKTEGKEGVLRVLVKGFLL